MHAAAPIRVFPFLHNGTKTEQQKIAKDLATIEHEIRLHNTAFKDDLAKINHASPERAKALLDTIKAYLQAYFGGGLISDILLPNSSSKGKNLMVSSKLEKSNHNAISSTDCQDVDKSEDKKKSASNFSDADLPYKSTFIKTHSNSSNFFGQIVRVRHFCVMTSSMDITNATF